MKLSNYLLLIVLITLVAWGSLFYTVINQDQKINGIVSRHSSTIQTIENNQRVNANAIKEYINCLITPGTLNPTDSIPQLKVAEQTCFDNAPKVN